MTEENMFEDVEIIGHCCVCSESITYGYEGYISEYDSTFFCSDDCLIEYLEIQEINPDLCAVCEHCDSDEPHITVGTEDGVAFCDLECAKAWLDINHI